MKTYAAVSLLCLLSLASSALGLKCYQCTGESCVDPYTPDGQHPVECTADLAKNAAKVYNRFSSALGSIGINAPSIGEPKMVCAKVTVKDTQAEVVSRSCAATSDSLDFCENMKNLIGDKLQHCSICEGDLCNSAPATYASLGLMTAVAVVLSYLH